MPGISGMHPLCDSLKQMTEEQKVNDYLDEKYSYKDDLTGISHISLKSNNFKLFEKNEIIACVDGFIYNIEETNKLLSLNCDNFQQQLVETYNNGCLDKLLNKTDGYFNAVVYDKKNKKILLISDRLGSRFLYWYHRDGFFAFSGEVKGLLACKNVNTEIDKDVINYWTDSQIFLFGEDTLFKNIKLIKPSTILEYDINKDEVSQHQYWTFNEIPQQNISYEEAIDKLHYLLENALLKRIKNIDLDKTILPISGGLDSRLLLAILYKYNKIPKYMFTIGNKKSLDLKIAKILCKKIKHKHIIINLYKTKSIDARENLVWNSDGMIPINELADIFGMLPKCEFLIQGYVGDAIMGGSLFCNREHLADNTPDERIAEELFGKYKDKSDYTDKYYNTPHIDVLLYGCRVRRYTNQMINESLHLIEPILPYIDKDLLNFIYSIPDKYRLDKNLYSDMLLKYYPEFFKNIPKTPDGITITGKINKNTNIIKRTLCNIKNSKFLNSKWKKSFLKRANPFMLGIDNSNVMQVSNDVEYISLQEKYINEKSLIKNYLTEEKFNKIKNEIVIGNPIVTSVVLSIELYLRMLNKRHIV